MSISPKIRQHERGSILLVFILTLPFLILIAIYYMRLSLTSYQVARLDQYHTMAQLAADAGADASVEAFSADNSWSGSGGPVTIHSDSKIKTTYTASISGDDTAKTIAITGSTYSPATASTPSRTVKIYVDLRPVTQGNYSVVAGTGGLVMQNNSKIPNGNIFVNGSLTMSNSAQIGLSVLGVGLTAVPVQVADQICPIPADATYPQVCSGTSHPPISISNPAHIYGKVTANNQTDGSHMSNPGLVAGSVTPQALPTYDRAAQKAAATNNMTGAAASCTSILGSVTWPANTKITGDVTISKTCSVTVQGNVWITGNLTLTNSGSIKPANSLGSTMPVVMVDGSTGVTFNNGGTSGTNLSLTGIEFITFYCGVGCNEDSTVTGTALAASQGLPTITMNNSSAAINAILYAYWSQVNIGNSGQIGAVVGQNILMSNTATFTLGGSVGGVSTTTWVVKGYRRQ